MMSLGAAVAFSQCTSETWGTTFFGCPTEETIGGKVYMAEAGLFKAMRQHSSFIQAVKMRWAAHR